MARHTRKVDTSLLKKVNLDEDEAEKCIIVSNIPSGTTEEPLQIHLMKSKNGGSDITKVQLLDKTTAAVVFEERDTVDTVLSKEQKFGRNKLELERYSELMVHKLTANAQKLNKSSPVLDTLDEDQATRSIVVQNLPPGTDEQTVTIHFQKAKHGGGDIDRVNMLGEDTAVVTFDEHETVRTSLSKKQEMNGKVLKLTASPSETASSQQVNKSSPGLDLLDEEQAARSIVVRNLPSGSDEQKVTIHFQKARHGGGDIDNVRMIGHDAAVVTFEKCETVKTALAKEQEFNGNVLTLTPYQSEFDAAAANLEENDPLIDFVDENQATRSIVVYQLPVDIDQEKVTIHFQKSKNGGGDIEDVKMVGKGTAIVTFDEPQTVVTALSTKQKLNGVVLKLVRAHVSSPKYEVFSKVTASLNRNAFSSLNDSKFEQLIKRLQQESQVRVEQIATKYLVKGTFLQVKSCYSLLQKYFSDKDTFWKMTSVNSHHSKDATSKKGTFRGVMEGETSAKGEENWPSSSDNDEIDDQEAQVEGIPQSPAARDHINGRPAFVDTAKPENDTGKLEVQIYETTPIIIRFIKKVYKDKLNVISEEFSVNLSGSYGDTKLTIVPDDACNELKYNDACNEFIELYQDVTQGVTKDFLTIKPEKTVSKEELTTVIRKTEEKFPVLIEQGKESNNWVIFGDRDSVEAAKENVHKQLGLSSDTGKGRRKRAPATRASKNDSVSETANVKNSASRLQGSPSDGNLQNSVVQVSKTGIKISVFRGDITEERVDAIVNAANTALSMKEGLGKAIVHRGGSSIQAEADDYIKRHGSVRIGQAIWTSAGKLPCKVVIHAVGPMDWPGKTGKKSQQILHNAYLNSLECAKSLKLKSVAVPAVGTGAIGVPLEVCATQLFNAVEQFWSKKGEVTDIRIVNLTDEADEVFKKEFSKRFNSGQSGKNPSKSKNVKGDSETDKDETNTVSNAKPNTTGTQQLPGNPQTVDESDDNCVICMDTFKNPVYLDKCSHKFCKGCIEKAFSHRKACPVCGTVYGMLTGNQPLGTMNWYGDRYPSLQGYERCGSIRINYYFPDGTQGPEHPNPGQRYYGTSRTAFLPDCPEGREVLELLRRAFEARLTFTIGTSVTTGMGNVVTWNDIHHKTDIRGGSTGYGYPDPTYLTRVKEELAAKGIV